MSLVDVLILYLGLTSVNSNSAASEAHADRGLSCRGIGSIAIGFTVPINRTTVSGWIKAEEWQ